jgi:hypothetical protein
MINWTKSEEILRKVRVKAIVIWGSGITAQVHRKIFQLNAPTT